MSNHDNQHGELIAPETGPDAAIARLGILARQINGIDIGRISIGFGRGDLPEHFPVGQRFGDSPALVSVKALADEWRIRPERKTGTAQAQTLKAFIDLVNRHKTPASAIFANADWKKPSFTAVINYHQKDAGYPDFGDHKVFYPFPLSEEWQAWIRCNGAQLSQEAFANFIEDHIAELSSPTEAEAATATRDFATTIANPAQLIELSRGLQVNVASRVKNAITLQTGEGQIAWEEAHNGADGKPIKVPGMFILAVSPFFMGEVVRIPVRLRYRVKDGALTWSFHIYRPDLAVTERVRHDLADVAAATHLPTFEAEPEQGK